MTDDAGQDEPNPESEESAQPEPEPEPEASAQPDPEPEPEASAQPDPEPEPEASAQPATPSPQPPPSSDLGDLLPTARERTELQKGIGRGLLWAGGLTIPLGIGAALGYWYADSGVLWVPTMVGWLTLVWLIGLFAMGAGGYLLGPALGKQRKNRRLLVLLAVLIILVSGVRILVAVLDEDTPLTDLESDAYYEAFEADSHHYRDLDRTLERLLRRMDELKALEEDGALLGETGEEQDVLRMWLTWVESAYALDRIRAFHEDYYRFDLSRVERDRHVRSFLLTFAAELALYEHTATLMDLVDRNKNVAKFLNVEREEHELPADSLTTLRKELTGSMDLSRVVAGKQYLAWLDLVHHAQAEARRNGYGWLWDEVRRQLAAIEERRGSELAKLTAGSDFGPLKAEFKEWTFPVQRSVAELMGDTKVRRAGRYLITAQQVDEVRAKCEPGDILLGRKNWYLSNVGLPGFWPHAMLYVGDGPQLATAFNDDLDVRVWVSDKTGQDLTFTHYLARTYPDAWRARASASQAQPLVIIEAIGEGVLNRSLNDAAGDYLAGLRPNLSQLQKAKAIDHAFSRLGDDYDFDFDFATPDVLVCSELVWRGYPDLNIPTVKIMGRKTLPPQEFAKIYAAEHGQDDARFEFVFFLEAIERTERAELVDEEAFLETPTRSKWDVAQR